MTDPGSSDNATTISYNACVVYMVEICAKCHFSNLMSVNILSYRTGILASPSLSKRQKSLQLLHVMAHASTCSGNTFSTNQIANICFL